MSEPFGFTVQPVAKDYRDPEYLAAFNAAMEARKTFGHGYGHPDYPQAPSPPDAVDVWSVDLPHQCDEWTITYGLPRAEAVAEMERFIAEAQAALEALRRGEATD